MGRLVGVFGTGGFGREVMALVRRQLRDASNGDDAVFVGKAADGPVNSVPVIAEDVFLKHSRCRAFVIAISDWVVRKQLYQRAVTSGAQPFEVRSNSAEVFDEVILGPGAILCGHSSITSNTRIGLAFQLNIASYVAHDCVVGDFVTFGPNVVCAGNVIVEDGAYIGAGAMIRQGKPGAPVIIGAGATVGMGAVVTMNVASGAVVAGNPARPIVKG